jgi:tetratricopeptide (TPR) repeat protein
LAASGRRALDRDDPRTAIQLLRAAVAIQPANDELDTIRLDLGQALADSGHYEESQTLAAQVAARSRTSGNLVLEARAVVLELDAETAGGKVPMTTASFAARLAAAGQVVERSKDASVLATYWRIVGSAEWFADRFSSSVAAVDRALALAESVGNDREARKIMMHKSVGTVSGPDPVPEARAKLEAMLASAGSIQMRVELLSDLGILLAASGASDEGRAHVAEALRLIEEFGLLGRISENRRMSAWIERLVGDYDAEIAFFDLAVDALQITPPLATASAYGVALESSRSLALAKVGRVAEARAGAERVEFIEASGWPDRLRDQAWARILAAEGRDADAATRAQEVETAASDIPFPFARAEALVESGVVAFMVGDGVAAERRARKALGVALAKESLAHQRKAEALLAGKISKL